MRNLLSKAVIRQYLRDTTNRDTYGGAPWIVKPEVANRFRVSMDLPAELVYGKHGRIRRRADVEAELASKQRTAAQAALARAAERGDQPVKPRWPIEDTEVVLYNQGAYVKAEQRSEAVPKPMAYRAVPAEVLGDFIGVWNFLFTFGYPIFFLFFFLVCA